MMILDLFLGREMQGVKMDDEQASIHFSKLQHEANNPNVHIFQEKKFSNSVSNIILMFMLMPWLVNLQGVSVDFRTELIHKGDKNSYRNKYTSFQICHFLQ